MSTARRVYVIGGETGPQKIGIAANVAERLKALQHEVPQHLQVHHHTPAEDARLVERMAHQLLAEKRLRGEWFDVTPAKAIAAIEQAIDMVECGDLPERPELEPLTFKVSAEFKRQFRMAAADRGIRLNELLIQAFDAWKAREAA